MTEPVKGIRGTKETSSGGTFSGSSSEERKKRKGNLQERDLVEISQDARDRFSGKKRKSIQEYLKELLHKV